MSTAATVPRLLTVDEAASRLGVHRITVYRWINGGRLPAVRLGGPGAPLRVDERELEAWLYGFPEAPSPVFSFPGGGASLAERGVPSGQSTAPTLARER